MVFHRIWQYSAFCPYKNSYTLAKFSCIPLLVFSVAVEAQSVETSVPYTIAQPVKSTNDIQFDFTTYNEQTYTVAYDVFLMNSKVEDAFQVAKAAVHFNPDSIAWREKLAHVASWAGHMQITLDQWLYFFDRNIKVDVYAPMMLALANQLGNYDVQVHVLEKMLKKQPSNRDFQLTFIRALQAQGRPKEAIKYLNSLPSTQKDIDYLKQHVQIAKGLQDTKELRRALVEWQLKDPNAIEPKLEQAKLDLNEGNFAAAWSKYQEIAKAPELKDPSFWHEYSQVALLGGRSKELIQAYRQLDKVNAIEKAEASNLVFLESSQGEKSQAYQHAKQYYFKFGLVELIPEVINLGSDLEKWQEAYEFYNQLEAKQKQLFGKVVDNLITLADVYIHINQYTKSYELWDRILAANPTTTKIQSGLLWFLMDTHNTKLLKQFVFKWCHDLAIKPELWRVYSVALSSLGKYRAALNVYFAHYPEIQKDYAALMDLQDLLRNTDQPYWAYIVSRNAANQFFAEIKGLPTEQFSLRQLLTWSQLVRLFAPSDMIYQAMLRLQNKLYVNQEATDQIIAYALEHDSYSLARLVMRSLEVQGKHVPEWMQLTLALAENDRVRLLDLIEHRAPLLQHRDRVTAAVRVEEYKKAEDFAYQGLSEHPFESEMYELFKQTMFERVNKFTVDTRYYVFNNLGGPDNKIEALYFITPSVSIKGYNTLWLPESNDITQVVNPPSTIRTTGLKFKRYLHRSWAELMVGGMQGLGDAPMAGLVYHRFLPKRWEVELQINYHEQATETAPLLVGGMKNTLGLGFEYKYNSYNLIETEFNYWSFNGQNNQWLGQGGGALAHWRHYFYLSYPDWNTNLYATYRKYKSSDEVLLPPLQTIVPDGTDSTADYYMPVGYSEVGLLFGLGQKYREEYTQRWRVFAEAGLSISDAFGLGNIFSAGYGGSVFGRDKLLFYTDYADNTRQAGQVIYQLGMRYDYYF